MEKIENKEEKTITLAVLIQQFKDGLLEDNTYSLGRSKDNREYLYINEDGHKDLMKYKYIKAIAEFTNYGSKECMLDDNFIESLSYVTNYSWRTKRKIFKIIFNNLNTLRGKVKVKVLTKLNLDKE